MEEFVQRLNETTLPNDYEKRFLDILDAVGDKAILTTEERNTLGLIIAYFWIKEYSHPSLGAKHSRAKVKTPSANKLPFDGNKLTKSQLGYRVPLANLPAKLVKQLFAYVYEVVG